jgi:hypothetical protein
LRLTHFISKSAARRTANWLVLAMLTVGLAASAQAQGIHTTLRSKTNPYNGSQSYASVWGDGHYAYIGSERRNGVLIYDITNPNAPVLASYYAPANSLDMEDVKVANGVGYFASNMGFGLHVVNVADPTNPQLLSIINSANGGYDNTHKIAVWNNFLFIPQNLLAPALIKVFDVSNPSLPILKTTFTATDPMWVNDITIQDNGAGSVRLYTAGWGGKCDIWDITNIATGDPVLLGSFSAGIDGSSSSATADGNYLAYTRKTTDGTSEVKIYNISDPTNVSVASTLTMTALGIDAVAPHDPKIMGNLLYVSWYQAGTLIFDITNPSSPILIGSYDTWPGAVSPTQLAGNWGVYPYLGQDRVLLSDRNTGLYIIDATGVSSQAALYNFKLVPPSVVGSVSSIGTVYLVGIAPTGGAVATLTSNNSLAVVPPSVTVPQGGTSGAFTVTTTAVSSKTTATLTATYGGAKLSSVLTLTAEIPSTLTFNSTTPFGGTSTTGTVTMAAPAPVTTVVTLAVTSGGSAVASIPSSVTVPMGSSTATFNVVTNAVTASTAVKVSASSNGTTVTGTFTVKPNIPKTFTFSPTSVTGGGSSTGTVTLSAAPTTDTSVVLAVTSGSSAVASIPGSVTVLAGTSTASFTLVTNHVTATTTVKVSATASGASKTASLTVKANSLTGFTFAPSSVTGGSSAQGTVTFILPVPVDTQVTVIVISGSAAVASAPTTFTIPAGNQSGSFSVSTAPVSQSTAVQFAVAAEGSSKIATLTVK